MQTTIIRRLLMTFVISVSIPMGGKVAAAQTYAITDLGTLGGMDSHAYGLNNHGVIVGDASLTNGSLHAFMCTNGMMMDLGTLGGTNSCAYGVNDAGQVVGDADLPGGMHHGLVAWKQNDRLGWQLYDAKGQPQGEPGSTASLGSGAAGVVLPEGRFALFP